MCTQNLIKIPENLIPWKKTQKHCSRHGLQQMYPRCKKTTRWPALPWLAWLLCIIILFFPDLTISLFQVLIYQIIISTHWSYFKWFYILIVVACSLTYHCWHDQPVSWLFFFCRPVSRHYWRWCQFLFPYHLLWPGFYLVQLVLLFLWSRTIQHSHPRPKTTSLPALPSAALTRLFSHPSFNSMWSEGNCVHWRRAIKQIAKVLLSAFFIFRRRFL